MFPYIVKFQTFAFIQCPKLSQSKPIAEFSFTYKISPTSPTTCRSISRALSLRTRMPDVLLIHTSRPSASVLTLLGSKFDVFAPIDRDQMSVHRREWAQMSKDTHILPSRNCSIPMLSSSQPVKKIGLEPAITPDSGIISSIAYGHNEVMTLMMECAQSTIPACER